MRVRLPVALGLALLGFVRASAQAPEGLDPVTLEGGSAWPQFLGASRDGSSPDAGLAERWLRLGLREQWRASVGDGYSGLAVLGERVYGMDRQGGDEFAFARRAGDGSEVWRVRTGGSPANVYGGLGPRVTPAVAGARLFTVSAEGDALALDAATGRVAWRRRLRAELGFRPPAEGTACSPLVAEGRVYLMNGGTGGRALLALEAETGRTIWAAQDDQPSYSSAVRFDVLGVPQALFLAGSALFSVDPASGRLLWKYSWPTLDFVNAATPLLVPPDRVFISAGPDQGAALLRIRRGRGAGLEVEEVWRNREMKNHFNNSVHHAGVLFGFDNAIFKAVDLETGITLWRERTFGKGSVVRAGAHLVVLGEEGELALVEPSREGLRVRAKLQVLSGRCWTPPSLAYGRIFLRSLTEIVALGS
jgi:outer membrane protein assembly factor BamB